MPLTQQQLDSLEEKKVDWRRISYVEASETLDALRNSNATLVDTRHPEQFEAGHFPDAVYAREHYQLLALPKDQSLYLYCT